MGQAGTYLIRDQEENALGLPSGYGVYDIPLVLSSKQYKKDGTLYSTKGETDSFWGDIIHVVSHHHQENSSLITVALI
jgi:bilirubin oxidase